MPLRLRRVWMRTKSGTWSRHANSPVMSRVRTGAGSDDWGTSGVRTVNVYLGEADGWWTSARDTVYAYSALHVATPLGADQGPAVFDPAMAHPLPQWATVAKGYLRSKRVSELGRYTGATVDHLLGAQYQSRVRTFYNSANDDIGVRGPGDVSITRGLLNPAMPLAGLAKATVNTGGYSGTRAWLEVRQHVGLIDFGRAWAARAYRGNFYKAVLTFDCVVQVNFDPSTANSIFYNALARTRWQFHTIEHPVLSSSIFGGETRRWSHPSFGSRDRYPTRARVFYNGSRPPATRGVGEYTRTMSVTVTTTSPDVSYLDTLSVGVHIVNFPSLDRHSFSDNVVPTLPAYAIFNGTVTLRAIAVHWKTEGASAPELIR